MRILWLVGMMGAGKTAVGETVARLSGLPFIDTDRLIEHQTGRQISAIWDSDGEDTFRDLEKDEIARIVSEGLDCVVATGGGAILDEESRRLMSESGLVIWLTAEIDILSSRIVADGTRPLLDGHDMEQRLSGLLDQRARWYARTSDHQVDTSAAGTEEVAGEVMRLWNAS